MRPSIPPTGLLPLLLLSASCLAAPSIHAHDAKHGTHHSHLKRDDLSEDRDYLVNKYNRIFLSHLFEQRGTEGLYSLLDQAAKAVIRSNAALSANSGSIPKKRKRYPIALASNRTLISTLPINTPSVQGTNVLGASTNNPDQQYLNIPAAPLPTLPLIDLTIGINFAVTEDFSTFYNGSGSLELTAATEPYLENMQFQPGILRDGGQGGTVNGQKLAIFCDTQTYSPSGSWSGFVSNSVAADEGLGPASGNPQTLVDKLGEFANSIGTMRNFIPFTVGEAAYNNAMEGTGQRFGIWPGSSLIPYNQDSALLYAPIIYTNTDPGAQLISYVGMTLIEITVPGAGGAVAARIAPMLVQGPGIQWGSVGGIRKLSFSAWNDGNANHGLIYIMGNSASGLFLAKVSAPEAADWSAYQFYYASTKSWSSTAPTASNTADVFMAGAYSTVDIFYSPKHLTFIMVYTDAYADNSVWWKYLQSDHAIHPSDSGDYVVNIIQYPWSTGQLLFQIPYGSSYAYAAGMYRGYFDDNDITEGGDMMLFGWTQPTGEAAPNGLTHDTAVVTWA